MITSADFFSHNECPVTVTDESYVCWSVLLGLTALSRTRQNHRPAYTFPDMQEIVLMYIYNKRWHVNMT